MKKIIKQIKISLVLIIFMSFFLSNVKINAKQSPILNVSNVKINLNEKFDPFLGVSADDTEDGNITDRIVVVGDVNTKKTGKYKLKYSVSDSNGNIAAKEIIVEVVESGANSLIDTDENTVVEENKETKPTENEEKVPNKPNEINQNEENSTKQSKETNIIKNKNEFNPFEELNNEEKNKEKNKENKIEVKEKKDENIIQIDKEDIENLNIAKKNPILIVEDLSIKIGENFEPLKKIKATDYLGNDITKNIIYSGTVDNKKSGEYIINYTVKDKNGKETSKNVKITVLDSKKPIINASNKYIKQGEEFNPLIGVTAKDIDNGDITSRIEYIGSVNTNKVGTYKIKYKVFDNDGNEGLKEIKVFVEKGNDFEETAKNRVIEGNRKINISSENAEKNVEKINTVENNEIIDNEKKIEENTKETQDDYLDEEATDYTEIKDDEGAFKDNKSEEKKVIGNAPVINGDDIIINRYNNFNPLDNVTIIDKEDGDITDKAKITGSVNTERDGEYTLLYSVTDNDGNEISKEIKVKVNADKSPYINASDITIKKGSKFNPLKDVTATDMENGDITDKITYNDNVNTSKVGEYEVTYKVADNNYNITEKTIKVKVLNDMKPVLNVTDKILKIGSDFNPFKDITAIDNEDGDISQDIKCFGEIDTTKLGDYKLVYEVRDSASQKTSKEINVTILADRFPIINAYDKSILPSESFNPREYVTAIDLEDGDITEKLIINNEVDPTTKGRYFVEYIVTDSSNNTSTKKILIDVLSNLEKEIKTLNVIQDKNPKIDSPEVINRYTKETNNKNKVVKKPIINVSDRTLLKGESFNPLYGVTAIDVIDGDITEKIVYTGEVNSEISGVYKIEYEVKNSNDIAVKKEVEITILDEEIKENNNEYSESYDKKNRKTKNNQVKYEMNIQNNKTVQNIENPQNVNKKINKEGASLQNNTNETVKEEKPILEEKPIPEEKPTVQEDTGTNSEYPVIKASDKSIKLGISNFNPYEGVTAYDVVDGDITDIVSYKGDYNIKKTGTYKITFVVTNSRNNTAKKTIQIIVADSSAF